MMDTIAACDKPPIESLTNEHDLKLAQANKLFQTGVMLIYGKRKSIDKAIKCIQRAITFCDYDYKYWQHLGEAYYQRGSLNPAINCFIRSLKLLEEDGIVQKEDGKKRREADCTYSLLRMSDIRLSVGHLDEAAVGYRDIISREPDNVAALIGLSKTELQMARNNFSSGLVKLGHSHCMNALSFALRAVKLCPHLCLTWKLAADCCLIQFVYGQRSDFRSKIEEKFPGGEEDALLIDKKTCIDLAQQFLCKALDIDPFQDSVCLWHNLGISLYLKSGVVEDDTQKQELLRRSIKCLSKALDFDRNNSQVRNSIGVVAFNLNLLNSAQNFLIRSIQTNMSTSEIQFSNLGYIYLQRGEFGLASVAFNRCQAEEPLYSRSWLGNALLSEQNNIDNLSQLRHCHRLENNYDSQLMFATKMTSLACSEVNHKDTVNALDCMKRMLNYNPKSLEAVNVLGLLSERCNHVDDAKSYFELAHKISPQDSRVVFNKLRQLQADSNSCWSLDGIEFDSNCEFAKSAEKLLNSGNREYILNYIYYLFTNCDYKSINQKMNRYLEKLPQSDVHSKLSAQILLGLSAKADKCDYKSWLFKNIIDSEDVVSVECVINLLCLMLIGTIDRDHNLVEQTIDDLLRRLLGYITSRGVQFMPLFYSLDGYWIRLTIFCSIFCSKDQSMLIKPLLMLFPMIAEFWLYRGFTLMFDKTKHQAAVFCIKKANLIGSSCADLSVVCDILLSILTQLTKCKAGVLEDRVKYLSRAVHKYPTHSLLWTCIKSSAKSVKTKIATERNKQRNNQEATGWTTENVDLLKLAVDHFIKMILAH